MEDFKERFYKVIAEWLHDRYEGGLDVKRVIDFKEVVETGGYCETCWYEDTEVHIMYEDSDGNVKPYAYYGNMADFIKELTN